LSTCFGTYARISALTGIVFAASALLGSDGWAQAPSPTATPSSSRPSLPVSDEPAATTATFGDWVMRCQRTGDGDKAVKTCEAAESIQVQGQTGPIAQIGIGRLAAGEPLRITVILPPNIILPSNVHVATDEKDDPGIELAWRRCLPGGCIAEAKLDSETIKSWRTRGEPGKLSYKDATGRVLAISFSFRGLARRSMHWPRRHASRCAEKVEAA
jgi:invasion protein IalB